jgi:hypothetical protein
MAEKRKILGVWGRPPSRNDLHVNFFQPSLKLKSKTREGGKVVKKYHAPATSYEQLLAERVEPGVKQQLRQQFDSLDPLELLS